MLCASKEQVTGLDFAFLANGQQWPPASEISRLERYRKNKLFFENEHSVAFAENFKRIERVIGNFEDIIGYSIELNYFRKISLKTADLLLGEAPHIKAGQENQNEQAFIDSVIADNELHMSLYDVAIDVSRFGVGLLYPHRDDSGKVVIDIASPLVWFPVFDAGNVRCVLAHILAWDYAVYQNPGDTTSKADYFLKVQIHLPGRYIERLYKLNSKDPSRDNKMHGINCFTGKTIGALINEKIVNTGIADMQVIHIPNVATSDNMLGYDDYEDVQSIIGEIEVRIAQIARILDMHASPTMAAPRLAFEMNTKGEWIYKPGKAIPMQEGVPEPKYITWDGQLDSAFKHLELLMQQLYSLSEMGAIVWGQADRIGNVPSGTALRRMMMSTLAKINRVRKRFDPAIKKAIKIAGDLSGKALSPVSILWQDGLPQDDLENAQIINMRCGGKATMSRQTAIERFDGISDVNADKEIERIDEDEAMGNGIVPPVFGN